MTAASTKVTGKIIKCTAKETTSGQTVDNTRATTLTTKKKAMASTPIQTEDATKDSGLIPSSMEKVYS